MKMLVTAAAIAVAMGGSAVASAGVFDFSYAFTGPGETGQMVTGSFDGTSTDGGQTVSDISNLQVWLNGIAFAGGVGPLQINAWNTTIGNYDDTTPVVLSAVESQNNFAISDVDLATGSPDYYFTLVNDPNPNVGSSALAANFMQSDSFSGTGTTQLALDGGAGTWTLTAAPVPLPAALPLLLSGLGGLGAFGIGRRRRAA
jgi:hypothetical protein